MKIEDRDPRPLILRLRFWLARKLLGNHGYVYNTTFRGGFDLNSANKDVFIERCTFEGGVTSESS